MEYLMDILGTAIIVAMVFYLNVAVGKKGVAGKLSAGLAVFQSLVVFGAAVCEMILLGDLAKNETLSLFFATIGLSGILLFSGFIILGYYRERLLAHPEEFFLQDEDVVFKKSYLFGGVVSFIGFGILLAGGGLANVVMNLVGDRRGVIYGLLALSPLLIAIFLFVKYRKWAMRYLLKELKEHGVLIEKSTSDEKHD